MKAIKDTGNVLVAALDKRFGGHFSTVISPDADFFTERLNAGPAPRKAKTTCRKIDFIVSTGQLPAVLHIRFGLRIGADVICEKPIVLNPWNIDALLEIERNRPEHIYHPAVALHPAIAALEGKD